LFKYIPDKLRGLENLDPDSLTPQPGIKIGYLPQEPQLNPEHTGGAKTVSDGLLVRRTCCQRNRLPDVQQCGDCTLK
jgi:ATPase subunit of ABC transporter with duplicated ATPase domains